MRTPYLDGYGIPPLLYREEASSVEIPKNRVLDGSRTRYTQDHNLLPHHSASSTMNFRNRDSNPDPHRRGICH